MTVVTGSFNVPGQSGNTGFSGSLWWVPTARHTSGSGIVLPLPFTVPVDVNGTMTPITVDPTGPTWVWKVTEQFNGIAQNVVRYVQVPTSGTVAYKDLVDVDPNSLQPNAPLPGVVDGGTAPLVNRFIQHRRDTAANWTSANPVLADGEPAYEKDTKKSKKGDGVTAWNSLPYLIDKASADAAYAQGPTYLEKWFAGGIRGKKVVLVGDSTTDYAYGLTRTMNYYTRRGRELAGVSFLNYGVNGQTLATWQADTTGRYGATNTIAQNADLYVLCYGVNDVRLGAMTEDTLTANLSAAVDSLRANGTSTVLLRVPATFTTTDTGALGFVSPNSSAQAYSTLLRNAYLRTASAKGCAILDSQALVFGLTSQPDTQSPCMLNQIHPNDAGNTAIARELVRMIGIPSATPPSVFSMHGKVGVGTVGSQTFANGGRVAFGFARYRPINGSGSMTIELRKFPANTVVGTVTYSGGYGSGNVMVPSAAAVEWITLAAGDSIQVAVTACTVSTYDLDVFLLVDITPPVRAYPLQLRGAGLVSSLDSSVVYAATETLTTDAERTIGDLKAVAFKRLGYNRFTKYSQDCTKSAVWTTSNVTITGTPGNQTITATATGSIAAYNAPATPGEQLTFSWRATSAGTPKYAIYDLTNATFVVASTPWPAADGNGWRNVTVTVPAGCTTLRCYPLSASTTIGDAITLTGMQLTAGAAFVAHAPTNSIGTAMAVNTGALPADFTLINLLKFDASNGGISVASPGGPNTDGNPALQIANGANFGYPVITTRGIAPRGANGTWQAAVLRVTGGNAYATVNDQAQSPAFAKAVNATDLRWNYLSAGDTTGSFQNWDGEVIGFYFPYLLTEGEAAAFVRAKLLTLVGSGETVTADIPAQKLY